MRLCAVFLLLLVCFPVLAQDARSDGDTAYLANDYPKAIEDYEAALSQFPDGITYYNLGHAYSQVGNTAQALLNYRRAALLLPRDADVTNQIMRVREAREDVIGSEIAPLNQLDNFVADWLTETELQIIIFGAWVAFWLIVILRLFRPQSDLLQIGMYSVGLVLSAVLITYAAQYYLKTERPAAIVMPEQISVMSGPGADFLPLYPLHAAAELRIMEETGNWIRFQLADGHGGWIPRQAVETIQ